MLEGHLFKDLTDEEKFHVRRTSDNNTLEQAILQDKTTHFEGGSDSLAFGAPYFTARRSEFKQQVDWGEAELETVDDKFVISPQLYEAVDLSLVRLRQIRRSSYSFLGVCQRFKINLR